MSYPKLHLPLQSLQKLFREQLRMELATTVTVESVEKARVPTEEVLQAVRTPARSHPLVWAGGRGPLPARGSPWGCCRVAAPSPRLRSARVGRVPTSHLEA